MDGNCPRQKLHFRKYKLLQSFKECFWMGIVLGDNYLKSLKETLFKRTKKKKKPCMLVQITSCRQKLPCYKKDKKRQVLYCGGNSLAKKDISFMVEIALRKEYNGFLLYFRLNLPYFLKKEMSKLPSSPKSSFYTSLLIQAAF